MSEPTRDPALRVDPAVTGPLARLMARYCSAIDNGELELWPACFAEDGVYRILTRPDYQAGRDFGIWYCGNRRMMVDRVSAIRSVNVYEPHVYRHVIGPTEIVAGQDGVLDCETSYQLVRTGYEGDMTLFSVGRYVDRVVCRDGAALFASRTVVTDSCRYDTLVALPI